MVIYISLDEDNNIDGWGTSAISDNSIIVEIDENDPFLNDDFNKYTIENGKIIKRKDFSSIELKTHKEIKKEEVSNLCHLDILNGYKIQIGGNKYHFTYDEEDQSNLQERWQLFQNNIIKNLKISARLDGESVRLDVDKELFHKIYMESVRAKETKISKLKDELYPIIDNCKTQTELDSITWEMDTIDPVPSPLELNDNHTLEKRIEDVRVNSAKSTNEVLSLVMMNMGMGGLF